MKDPYANVRCELPGCGQIVPRRMAVPVSVVFDGTRLRGLACSHACAAELQRGWSTRDAYGAQFLPPSPVAVDLLDNLRAAAERADAAGVA